MNGLVLTKEDPWNVIRNVMSHLGISLHPEEQRIQSVAEITCFNKPAQMFMKYLGHENWPLM